ncbi:MAG TPA: ABC transporter ATP-binding protein, partial [Cytophagales bacterium]|nr:ABC transporter ATP-binding protein [Cytophagales bacterium]
VFAVVSGFFLFLTRQTIIVMSRLIENDLKNDIYAHLQSLNLSFYKKNNTGDVVARMSEDVGKVRMYLGPAVMYGINMLTSTVATIYFMFQSNVELAIYSLLPMPLLSYSIFYISRRIENYSTELQENLSDLSTTAQESFAGIRVVKSFAKEETVSRKFEQNSASFKSKSMQLTKIQGLFQPLMIGLIGLSITLVVFVGSKKVMNGELNVGYIAQFILYIINLTWPFTAIGWVTSIVQRAEASQARLNELFDHQNEILSEKQLRSPLKGHVVFSHVNFKYEDTGIQALKDVSFDILPGQSLGILGSTGSGKSTIAALALRMYDVSSGRIFIDGHDIKDYDPQYLKKSIGYVPQDVFLFSDTIKNNIAFGVDEASLKSVERVAELADVHKNIVDFPQQYETMLGERGITLSGGQKQRVSIARALIKEPKILILDDCLSAVDTKTEHTILNNLRQILRDRTSIIISHRVSSVKLADKIIVLDQGEVVEVGTHDDLLKMGGVYKAIYEKQSSQELV